MEFINNRQVNLWRGSNEPPTKYHIWIKDDKLLLYNGEQWIVFVDNFESISDLKKAIEKLSNSTVNGRAIKDNPILTSLDILIGKDLNEFSSNDSIFSVLESLSKSYSEGYSIEVKEDLDGGVIVKIGQDDFKIKVTGENLSVKTKDNTIIFDSNALTSVPTEDPLEWTKDRKLIHQDSGVVEGTYGANSDQQYAQTMTIPKISVDAKGHITEIENKSITIREYVNQLKPDDSSSSDKPIILAYTEGGVDQTNPVRQASGLTYNDKSGELKVKGAVTVGGGVNVNGGDLHVAEGYKIYGEIYGNITGTATPKIHSSKTPQYGAASTNLYGHVIVQDELGITAPPPTSTNSDPNKTGLESGVQVVAASPLMVWNALETAKKYTREYFSDDFVEEDNKIYLRWEEIK